MTECRTWIFTRAMTLMLRRFVLAFTPLAILPQMLAVLLATGAGLIAWRFGGGAEHVPAPSARSASAAATERTLRSIGIAQGAQVTPGDEYEVSLRLVERAKDARFDMPRAEVARAVMNAHRRQQKPPLLPMTEAARFVRTIALPTSASEAPTPVGKAWAPDARRRNTDEGSFDQRESLVSPTPGVMTFRVDVPRGARLTFAEGTVNATEDATMFVVSVRDSRGTQHDVYRHVVEPGASRRWTDAHCDLSAFAGQEVELRFSTNSAHTGPGKMRPSVTLEREDVLAKPSAPVALWGNPTILAKTRPRAPFNVLWIVVDALRPDAIASFHDDAEDAAKQAASLPPLEALLPKIAGLTPEIDDLAQRGVRFTHAYSAGAWTRPGTLAMLAGARSSELGIDATEWTVTPAQASRFYGSDPPLLPLSLRRHHVTTHAFVNNPFIVGYVPVGIDVGFERVSEHRTRTRDTLEITRGAAQWIRENKETRFFAFVNYRLAHDPAEPPAKYFDEVPPPPLGPKDKSVRRYLAEAAKADEAIGVLMRTLDETGLRDRTIVVVTAGHGRTMSSAQAETSGSDNFEQTTKVPILIALPGVVPPHVEVKVPVRTIDIAPTVLELLGIEPHARVSGTSLLPLAKGEVEPDTRVVVSEGRGSRSILHGRFRLIVRERRVRTAVQGDERREAEVELFDLVDDPGERRDVAADKPEIVAEMRARLEAALNNVPVAGMASAVSPTGRGDAPKAPTLHLRFAGGASSRRVSGSIVIGDAETKPRSYEVHPVELGRDAFHRVGNKVELALRTSPSAAVGFDIVVDPPTVPIRWELWLGDEPWPEHGVFGGPFGLPAPVLKRGITSDEARLEAQSMALPTIVPQREVGLFVVRAP